jgi:hypothetical protein
MDTLKTWLLSQYHKLEEEKLDVDVAQYKREGMLIATNLIIQKVEEIQNVKDNINEGSPGEGETAEGTED